MPGAGRGFMRKRAPVFLASLVAGLSCGKDDVMGPPGPRNCVQYAGYLHLNGSVDTPQDLNQDVYDIALAGSHAWLAVQFFGLQAIDISNPMRPQLLAASTRRGRPWALPFRAPMPTSPTTMPACR